jgi:hypothetical protein
LNSLSLSALALSNFFTRTERKNVVKSPDTTSADEFSLVVSPQDGANLPPLSISILGVEPVDEFIKEVADFVSSTDQTSMVISRLKRK